MRTKTLKTLQTSFSILLVCFLFNSCMNKYKRIQFSQQLRNNLKLQKDEIKNLQFYLSERIVLQLARPIDTYKIQQGKLERTMGDSIEQVIIEKGTPGTIVPDNPLSEISIIKITDDELKISFDKKSYKYLVFKQKPYQSSDVSLYYLSYLYEQDRFMNKIPEDYKYVKYGDRFYEHKNAENPSYLLVDEKTLYKATRNRIVLPGRKLKDNIKQQTPEPQKTDNSKK